MKERYLIDIGSSTVKVYRKNSDDVKLVVAKTFDFKKDFTVEKGISLDNKKLLFSFFIKLCKDYTLTKANTKIFATGIFREMNNPEEFVGDFYEMTGLYFNIISHELEGFYLEKAWLEKCIEFDKVLVINIGGKTTELIVCKKGCVKKKELLSIGVGTVMQKYASINNTYSDIELNTIVEDIYKQLPTMEEGYPFAIYTGGELDYMKVTGYPLLSNSYFEDKKHPFYIDIKSFCNYNKKVYSDFTIEELRSLMPDNPDWMNGARACSALAQAICTKYSVRNIVPSNSNLIDGVAMQEARKVVLCGSFNKHLPQMSELMNLLNEKGMCVLSPNNTTVIENRDGFVLFDGDCMVNNCKWSVERRHIKAIKECDMIIVCNYDGYCGHSTGYEWARADGFGKKVVFLEDNELSRNLDFPFEIGLLE